MKPLVRSILAPRKPLLNLYRISQILINWVHHNLLCRYIFPTDAKKQNKAKQNPQFKNLRCLNEKLWESVLSDQNLWYADRKELWRGIYFNKPFVFIHSNNHRLLFEETIVSWCKQWCHKIVQVKEGKMVNSKILFHFFLDSYTKIKISTHSWILVFFHFPTFHFLP